MSVNASTVDHTEKSQSVHLAENSGGSPQPQPKTCREAGGLQRDRG